MDNHNTSSGIAYTKGAAEIVLEKCTFFVNSDGAVQPLELNTRNKIALAIDQMAKESLRTIAVAHRFFNDIAVFEPLDTIENELVFDALFGIKDPLRPDVKDSVLKCQAAGIFVRMVTGDNIDTAKAIAKECGILTEEGIAMEGPAFRKLTPKQVDAVLPLLQVLARSSPDDKHTLVTRLNGHNLPESQEQWELVHPGRNWETEKDILLPGYAEEWKASRKNGVGEVVGVTGDGTNDGPALKAADVGLSMGLSGTDGYYFLFFIYTIFLFIFCIYFIYFIYIFYL
jgi:magnesium-transporting ATPase (P-type)